MLNKQYKILLVEDDRNYSFLLSDYLMKEGFNVTVCHDGKEGFNAFNNEKFNLCLLDVMMPVLDGFSLAKEIRKKDEHIPVIFITAKSLKADKQNGYLSGANDYIIKPFDEEELVWKIKAMIKRSVDPLSHGKITLGNYEIDFANQLLSSPSGKKRLTEKETLILEYLSNRKNCLIRKEQMLKDLWGRNDYFLGRSLDVFITKMRKYLGDDPAVRIETVFKVGFILHAP